MDILTIDKMIENAKLKWEINHVFATQCKRENNPDAFTYTKSKIKYSKIIKRLE